MRANPEGSQWRAKLAAWIHDPPEKALVLMRGRGHERGTVSALSQELFGSSEIPPDIEHHVREADRWAAAADRPDRPRANERYPAWDRVHFPKDPILVHPLSGERYSLESLRDFEPEQAEALATNHFLSVVRDRDPLRAFHQLWRRAPSLTESEIPNFWRLLPADTRIPDHSIWDHLGLTSAFAGIFSEGNEPALFQVNIGPVQEFIAQGRSTSDLWAGSHLLSALSWEAMKPICEEMGPDAILFPNLRGVPIVDAWLEREGLVAFDKPEIWHRRRSDANPLFSATLPNRFVALVPASEVERLAASLRERVRTWVRERAESAWERIARLVEIDSGSGAYAYDQVRRQLESFPEIHWAAVPWSLGGARGQRELAPKPLMDALALFHGQESGGFFGSPAWQVLGKDLEIADKQEGGRVQFWKPNPGLLYPALSDLVDRGLAAGKATRAVPPAREEGYRCSLCGEREWLGAEPDAVKNPRGEDHPADPWPRVAERRPAWARGTEHLCAVCALKRLWPALFSAELEEQVQGLGDVRRYVVSTHTMALAPALTALAQPEVRDPRALEELDAELASAERALVDLQGARVALPRQLAGLLDREDSRVHRTAAALDRLQDAARDEGEGGTAAAQIERIESGLRKVTGAPPERYYALLLVDGDQMGAWLSSRAEREGGAGRPIFRDLFHPNVAQELEDRFENIGAYLSARAPSSPGYHAALSSVLASLSSTLFPEIAENFFRGKVLYAGGDDLLVMAPVEDLLPLMLALRCTYSGILPPSDDAARGELSRVRANMKIGGGHVLLKPGDSRQKNLHRAMGSRATCSMGVVVAHHSAPLGALLRDLRGAEKEAKAAGRNAFCLRLAKRAGGTTDLSAGFGLGGDDGSDSSVTPLGLLIRLRDLFGRHRRAAYRIRAWLEDLVGSTEESEHDPEMIAAFVNHQLRQSEVDKDESQDIAKKLIEAARSESRRRRDRNLGRADPVEVMSHMIGHAEFLARPERAPRGTSAGETGIGGTR